MRKIASKITELVGGTPLLELTKFSKNRGCLARVVAKLEYFNPAGSVKDRVALNMVEQAEKDGIQALKNIKANDPSAVVVMCSAMGQQAMVIESIQAGAKDFIVKPFQAERVLEAVKKVVG